MKKIFPIIDLSVRLSSVERTVGYMKNHFENDAEHSYQLALVSWSANEQYKLGLNNELILKLSLVHDLLEVYAGDTDAHGDKEKIALKNENEKRAFEKIKSVYSGFDEIIDAIEIYEVQNKDEAKLVFFLDKIIPDVNIYNCNSSYYKDRKVSYDGWRKWLFGRIDYDSLNEKLKFFVDESVAEVDRNFQEIFYKE